MTPWCRLRTMFLAVVTVGLIVGCERGGNQPAAPDDQASQGMSPGELGPAELSQAEQLLEEAIRFHDPSGHWVEGKFSFEIEESRPDGTVRPTHIEIDNAAGTFLLESEREGQALRVSLVDEKAKGTLRGRPIDDPEEAARLRLDQAGMLRLRNYYLYLYGLPMKLRDPGTRIDPEVEATEFQGQPAKAIRVSYDPEVGGDVWYFYFGEPTERPETGGGSELIGYRFYHDEAKGDGEYIVLEGLAEVGTLRLPERRTWFTNLGDELLGVDALVGEAE